MIKTLELHNYLREMVDSNDERLVIKDENLGVEIGLFDHAFLLSCEAQSEIKQFQKDKAELVEFVKMIANGKTECGESAIIHTKIHADAANELLEKYKC
tara:strand:- start:9195 stop:9491 length:297 start_codon:yes stop_codon:yes gene_type:complete